MPAIPNAQPYSGPSNFVPSIIGKEPKEGRKSIPYLINWSRPFAAGLDTVSFNPQGNSPLDFSQITGLIVDNSQCGASLDFIFPDTDVTISIPAYTPYTVLQVNSRAIQFYVRALGAIPSDVTSFAILNYAPMPVSVPPASEQLVGATTSISATDASQFFVIPGTVNGTIEDFSINFNVLNSSVSNRATVRLLDGTDKVIATQEVAVAAGQTTFATLANLSGIAIRFSQGLRIRCAASGGGLPEGFFSANVYYRTP